MIKRSYTKVLLTAFLIHLVILPNLLAEDASRIEYKIKAAFLYNFLKFIEWPEQKKVKDDEPLVIGIIGKDVFGDIFDELKDKKVDGKKVVVKKFRSIDEIDEQWREKNNKLHPDIDAIRGTHLLFICPSEKDHFKEVLDTVREHGVLTVADTEGFLEIGGIINLLTENKKIRFEINLIAAKQSKIDIRSQLLRLAKRTIRDDDN